METEESEVGADASLYPSSSGFRHPGMPKPQAMPGQPYRAGN